MMIPNLHMKSLPIKFIIHKLDSKKACFIDEHCDSSHFNRTVSFSFTVFPEAPIEHTALPHNLGGSQNAAYLITELVAPEFP